MANATTIQETRDRVLQLAREIEQLTHSNIPPQSFFEQFLSRVVSALGARAGAVWLLGPDKRLNLVAEVRLADTGLLGDARATRLNQQLLSDVMANGQARTHSPDEPGDIPAPTEHLIVLAALHSEKDKRCVGVVEIFQRPESPKEAWPGYLQFCEQMTGYASRFLDRQQRGKTSSGVNAKFWEDFEHFVLDLQHSLNVSEIASTAANDGRLLLDSDRVSVALVKGKKITITAISGQDSVNQRANLVRSMTKLATSAIAMRERVTYSGKIDHLPPQIEEPLAGYIQESGSRMVMLVPLFETKPLLITDDEGEKRKRRAEGHGKAFGCLIVEQQSESQPQPGLAEKIDVMTDHIAAALFNARNHEQIFLLGLWRFLGSCLEWFHGRKLAKTLAVLAVVTGVILAMLYVPWDYRVEGEGRLMPVVQQQVFAALDGEVVEIYVQGGQKVEKGTPLLKLRNDELQEQLVTVVNQLNERKELLGALHAQLGEAARNADRVEETRLQGRIVETQIEMLGFAEQRKVLEERRKLLTVTAPITGVVASFKVEQLLENRPVRRGETLLQVMDETGDWWLELEVQEHRMGHIARAQQNQPQLPIEFILATKPESTFQGKLVSVASRAVNSEAGSVIEAIASIDDVADLPDRRIGAEVRAKVNCGKRSLGYVLFGDVVEFIQQRFWGWW
jgi:multidrug efflux pump subunit AcrA (membrane-fusion protein)